MIKKKYLTKRIYAYDCWYHLVSVQSPNKYEDHLLLRRETGTVNPDDSPTFEYIVVMDGNDDWLPDTPAVRELAAAHRKLLLEDNSPRKKLNVKFREIHMDIYCDKPKAVRDAY